MKNIQQILLLIALITLFLLSCSEDDDTETPTEISIVGTWKPISYVNVCNDGTKSEDDLNACKQRSRYVFNEFGTVNFQEYNFEDNNCEAGELLIGSYEVTGDLLTLDWDYGEIDKPTIFKLNTATLEVGYYDNDVNGNCTLSHYYTSLTRVN